MQHLIWKVYVEQSLYKPGQALMVPAVWCSQSYNRHMARLSDLRTGRLYPQGSIPGIHFCSSLSRIQCHSVDGRIMSIEPATFRLVAQFLNQLHHRETYSRMGTSNVLYTQLVVMYKGLCLQFRNVLLVTVLKFVCFGWWESQKNCD
jgi:hypothetical protein